MDFQIGDIVYMKKPHPCGNHEWEVLRTGIDFRMKCLKCGHLVMLPRAKFERGVKKILARTPQGCTGAEEKPNDNTL